MRNTLPFSVLNHNYIVHISFSSYALWYKTWLGSQNSLSFTKSKFSTSFTYPYIPTKFEHTIFLPYLWVQIYCKALANSTSIFSCFIYFPPEDKIPKSNCPCCLLGVLMIFLCQKFAKIVVMLKIHLWAAILAPC